MADRRFAGEPGNPLRFVAAVIGYVKKALVAAAGVCSVLVAGNYVHGTAGGWCQLVLALASTAGVYQVRNGPAPALPRRQAGGRP